MIGRDWYVGMKVVFVGVPDDSDVVGLSCPLEKGMVYTILDIHFMHHGEQFVVEGGKIYTAGYEAIYIKVGVPNWYLARAFRPVQKRKSDISIFTSMLTGAREREPA